MFEQGNILDLCSLVLLLRFVVTAPAERIRLANSSLDNRSGVVLLSTDKPVYRGEEENSSEIDNCVWDIIS